MPTIWTLIVDEDHSGAFKGQVVENSAKEDKNRYLCVCVCVCVWLYLVSVRLLALTTVMGHFHISAHAVKKI